MNFLKRQSGKWKWRPKRWWIFLIVFWLFCTVVGKYLFGIEPKTKDQVTFIMGMTFLVVIFAAITDRQHKLLMRIVWPIIAGIFYHVVMLFLFLFFGNEAIAAFFASLIVVTIAIRYSKLFVEPAERNTIDEKQKDKPEMMSPTES